MEIRKDIGTVIKSRRLEKNLSQEALSNSFLV